MDDEEIARKAFLLDQRELPFDAFVHGVVGVGVTPGNGLVDEVAQVFHRGVALGHHREG